MNMNVEQQKKYESYFLKQSDKTLEFSAIMKETDGFKNATVLHARRVAKLMIDFIFATPLVEGEMYFFQRETRIDLLIFTSEEEKQKYARECIHDSNTVWYYFDNDELLDILNSEEVIAAQVNIMGETFAFGDHNLNAMIYDYIHRNMVGVGEYITGEPKESPKDLLNELATELSNDPGINAAYLYQSSFLGSDNNRHNNMVVVLDMPVGYYVHVEEFVYLIADAYNLSNQLIVAHAASDYGKMLLDTKIEPFYKK